MLPVPLCKTCGKYCVYSGKVLNYSLDRREGVASQMVQSEKVKVARSVGPLLTALHYLFSHESGKVVAHCLELDIATHGRSIEEAEESLNMLVLYQISTCYVAGNLSQLKFKAPFEYWQALEGARDMGTTHLEVEVPPLLLPVSKNFILPVMRRILITYPPFPTKPPSFPYTYLP